MITLGKAISNYKESSFYSNLSRNTKLLYDNGLAKFEDYFGGSIDIKEFTPRKCYQFQDKLIKNNHSVSSSKRLSCGPSAMFNYLRAVRDLSFNPMATVDCNPQYNPREVVWTKDERLFFIKTAHRLKLSYMAAYLDFLYQSAQRVFEIKDLRFDDILVDPNSGHSYFPIEQAKTRAQAPVWVNAATWKHFQFDPTNPPEEGRLFTKRGQPVSRQTIGNDFGKIKRAAGLRKELQLRDLRRSRASDLMATGKYSASQVMALTGHRNEQIFKSTYVVTHREATQWMLENEED